MYSIIFTLVRQYLTRIVNLSILIPANCAVYYRNIVSTERGTLRLKGKREGNSKQIQADDKLSEYGMNYLLMTVF